MIGASSSENSFFFRSSTRNIQAGSFMFVRCLLFLIAFSIGPLDSAPHRSKSKGRDGPQLVYDQKQTGDYNIQLHLKDFQIIALLGDDALGDYEYNYDYADFTMKPSGSPPIPTESNSSSTTRPTTTTTTKSPSSTSQISPGTNTTDDKNNKPEATTSISPSSTSSNPSGSFVNNIQTTLEDRFDPDKKPNKTFENDKTKDTETPSEVLTSNINKEMTAILNEILSSNLPPSVSSNHYLTSSSTNDSLIITSPSPPQSSPTFESMTPGKIKVQIIGSPSSPDEAASDLSGIVPGEDIQMNAGGTLLHGELSSYRKCATGFSRDKKGRCRRVRRPGISPQLPFGFGRIASNLATRLRLPTQSIPAEAAITTDS